MASVFFTKLVLWILMAGFICGIAKGLSLLGVFSTAEILIGLGISMYMLADNTKE